MISLHQTRNTNVGGGTIDVRNSNAYDQLHMDDNDTIQDKVVPCNLHSTRKKKTPTRSPTCPHGQPRVKLHLVLPSSGPPAASTSCCTMRPSTMDADTLIHHTLKLQDWLNKRQLKSVQEKADVESKNTRKLYTDVLETENTFVKELGNLVAHKDMLGLRKKEMLHKKWSENVYEPIRKQVDGQIHGPGYKDLTRHKRQLHKEYLEHVNKKGHVFLDTIAPDEYNAMALHPTRPSFLTAHTQALKDPLLNQGRARCNEDRIIYQCEMGSALSDKELQFMRLPQLPLVPLGRHGTECKTWLEMPMGDIESPVRMASRHRFDPSSNESQIDFPRWAKLQFRTGQVDEELNVQTKRMYTQELPNDRTISHSTVSDNCGGPDIPIPRRWHNRTNIAIFAPSDLKKENNQTLII